MDRHIAEQTHGRIVIALNRKYRRERESERTSANAALWAFKRMRYGRADNNCSLWCFWYEHLRGMAMYGCMWWHDSLVCDEVSSMWEQKRSKYEFNSIVVAAECDMNWTSVCLLLCICHLFLICLLSKSFIHAAIQAALCFFAGFGVFCFISFLAKRVCKPHIVYVRACLSVCVFLPAYPLGNFGIILIDISFGEQPNSWNS